MPRCTTCRRTGFTVDELTAHEKKFSHKRDPDEKQWNTLAEFEKSKAPTLSKDELLAAMSQMLTKDDLKQWLQQLQGGSA